VKRYNRFVILLNDSTLHFRSSSQKENLEWIHVALLNAAFLAEKYVAPFPVYKRGIQTVPGKCAIIQSLDNTAVSTDSPRDKKYPLWEFQRISPDKIILKWNAYYISVDSQGRIGARTDHRTGATIFTLTKYHSHKFSLSTAMGKVIVHSGKIIVSPEPSILPNIFMELIPLFTISIVHPKGYLSVLKNGQLTITKTLGNNEKFILEKIDENYHIKSHSGKYLTPNDRTIIASKEVVESNEKFFIERRSTGLSKIKTNDGNYFFLHQNNTITLSANSDSEFEIIYF